MNGFTLILLDSLGSETFEHVISFVGADGDGSFGVMSGHIHMVTVLSYGLARFYDQHGVWRYLAIPGAVLRFVDNKLTITTVRYFLGFDRNLICQQLADEMATLDSEVHKARLTLVEIEHSLVRRLAELSKNPATGFIR